MRANRADGRQGEAKIPPPASISAPAQEQLASTKKFLNRAVLGAGGIGFQLKSYIDGFEYTKATTMMLVLLVVVTVIDAVSSQLRRHLDAM